MTKVRQINRPKVMSRQDRLDWCIVFTKQSLRDCAFWRFREIRKLKADLRLYKAGLFPT